MSIDITAAHLHNDTHKFHQHRETTAHGEPAGGDASRALLEGATFVLHYCRGRDRMEIEAVVGYQRALSGFLKPWLDAAVLTKLFEHAGTPAALVAAHEITPRTVSLSLIATYHWRRVAVSVAKWAKRECMPRLLGLGYARAECRTLDGHDEAQRFLKFLGFTLECSCPEFGARGETFLLYAWRSKDHAASSAVQRGRECSHEGEN